MKTFLTQLRAINNQTGELATYMGMRIPAESHEDAQRYCDENGMGYLRVIGEFIEEIDSDIDYINQKLN